MQTFHTSLLQTKICRSAWFLARRQCAYSQAWYVYKMLVKREELICQQGSFDLTAQSLTHYDPFNAVDLSSAFEKDDGGYAVNFPLFSSFPVLLRIYPGKHYPSLIFFANRFKLWVLYLTCAAVLCRKVYQNHLFYLEYLFRKILV